jgi:hypothetical protein
MDVRQKKIEEKCIKIKKGRGKNIEQKGGWKKRKQGQKKRCNGRMERGEKIDKK